MSLGAWVCWRLRTRGRLSRKTTCAAQSSLIERRRKKKYGRELLTRYYAQNGKRCRRCGCRRRKLCKRTVTMATVMKLPQRQPQLLQRPKRHIPLQAGGRQCREAMLLWLHHPRQIWGVFFFSNPRSQQQCGAHLHKSYRQLFKMQGHNFSTLTYTYIKDPFLGTFAVF